MVSYIHSMVSYRCLLTSECFGKTTYLHLEIATHYCVAAEVKQMAIDGNVTLIFEA